MSFRTRLIGFFVLIVVVPMIAVGFLVFRLIGDSQQGKADARASGVASAAANLYRARRATAGWTRRRLRVTYRCHPTAINVRTLVSRSGTRTAW